MRLQHSNQKIHLYALYYHVLYYVLYYVLCIRYNRSRNRVDIPPTNYNRRVRNCACAVPAGTRDKLLNKQTRQLFPSRRSFVFLQLCYQVLVPNCANCTYYVMHYEIM